MNDAELEKLLFDTLKETYTVSVREIQDSSASVVAEMILTAERESGIFRVTVDRERKYACVGDENDQPRTTMSKPGGQTIANIVGQTCVQAFCEQDSDD